MKRLLPILAMLSLSGCLVRQSTYDALKKDFDDTKASLEGQNADLREQLASEKDAHSKQTARAKLLDAKVEGLEEDLAQTRSAKASLEAERSTILKDKSQLQASIDEMQKALAELAKRKAEADARIAEFKSLLDRFKALIDAGKLKVKIADGRMVVELASDVLFASGSANLSKDGKAAIAEVGTLLAEIPGRKFQVEGHTDNIPISTAQYPSNWELASARALTVLKTMVDAGMPIERISAASYGDSKPAKPNDSPEGRAANRRIEIVVVPDLSSLPGFDELNRASVK